MSKLLKLKEWVTLDEAARHISGVAGEDVTQADVLRLGLDRRLQLSVYLVNHAQARRGKVMDADEAPYHEFPIEVFPEALKLLPPDSKQTTIRVPAGEHIGPGTVVVLEDEQISLGGVYDLPPYGAAHLDVEHQYQMLTGGPAVSLETINGTFVVDGEVVYQLQADFDDNEFDAGSKAALIKIKRRVAEENLPADTVKALLDRHAVDRAKSRERWKKTPESRWYPAGGLPRDSVLVVRTKALTEFLALLGSDQQPGQASSDSELKARERHSWQALVGALVELLVTPNGPYTDHTAVVAKLVTKYQDDPPDGLSKSNLRKVKESVDYHRGIAKK